MICSRQFGHGCLHSCSLPWIVVLLDANYMFYWSRQQNANCGLWWQMIFMVFKLLCILCVFAGFLAHDSIYAERARAYMLLPVRPSVCLSVCHTVDQTKMVEDRVMQISPQSSPRTNFFIVKFTAKFQRDHKERRCRMREVWEKYAVFSQ